jgi:hypothetical protein
VKIGLFVDNMRITVWQRRALLSVADGNEFLVYNCRNTRRERRRLKYWAYYALNLFTVRNPLSKLCSLPANLQVTDRHDFRADDVGRWHRLPPEVIEQIRAESPAVMIKFGMGLLEVPASSQFGVPIISYHHGDPDAYRGRPAGFYELLNGERAVGQIVQRLSNELDAGQILAFAETKAFNYSYRATLIEAFGKSPLLLRSAIENAVSGTYIERQSNGPLYRLPSTWQVARFLARSTSARLVRLLYGAFIEKRWHVSTVKLSAAEFLGKSPRLPPRVKWKTWPTPPGYTFIADPFFTPSGSSLLVEALKSTTGKGQIFELGSQGATRRSTGAGHYSYPAVFNDQGTAYVIPEVSLWSPPLIFTYGARRLTNARFLDIAGDPRLLDPTLIRSGTRIFLFANRSEEGPGVLRLWCSDSLFGRFEEHRCSPIRISPNGSRMAGQILCTSAGMFRFGQRWEQRYGDGIETFEINDLSEATYRETARGSMELAPVKGPHTLNFRDSMAVFDWYEDHFTLLAGIRRALAVLSLKNPRY